MFGSAASPYDEVVSESDGPTSSCSCGFTAPKAPPAPAQSERTRLIPCLVKATDENLASEDWALNMDVCDRVSGDGQTGYVLPAASPRTKA